MAATVTDSKLFSAIAEALTFAFLDRTLLLLSFAPLPHSLHLFFSGIFVFRQALKLGLNLCQHVACLANTLFGSLMVWGWKAPRMVPLEACRWPVGFIVVAKVTLEPTAIAAGFGLFAALDVGSLPGMLLEAVGKVLKHRLCFFGLRA